MVRLNRGGRGGRGEEVKMCEGGMQTIPVKSWFTIFRLYGPLQPCFDKSWKLPDIEEVK